MGMLKIYYRIERINPSTIAARTSYARKIYYRIESICCLAPGA